MGDAELAQRAADLGQPALVDPSTGLGRVEVMAAAIGVEGAEQALGRDRLVQPEEARLRPFLLDQDRRVDPARRIVERDHQVVQPIQPDQPAVARAVLEQKHARQRTPRPLLAMRRPAPGLLHQPRRLQGQPGHRVAQPIAVVALKLLVRMLGRMIEIALAEQRAGPGEFPGIRAPRRRLAKTPILQPLSPFLRVA